MKFRVKAWIYLIAVCCVRIACAANEIPLYSGAIPNAIEAPDEEKLRDPSEASPFLLNISRPTMTVYLPDTQRGSVPAIVILPGGSYRGVSIEKEGRLVAQAFNRVGVAAFVVKYRSPNDTHMTNRSTAPQQDVERALQVVRERATEWRIDPDKIGLMGFSAGGHAAATAATLSTVKPAYVMLVYPVISMADELTHAVSRANLLGASPGVENTQRFSLEQQVTSQTPPTFLVHAADDKSVKVENSLRYFEALRAHGVEAELHIYPHGGHGFGLSNATTPDYWFDRCLNWLRSRSIMVDAPAR